MHETGTVKRIADGQMDVVMADVRPEVCATCRACEVFGQGKETVLRVAAVDGVAVGDTVTVDVPEVSPWSGIIFVLGLPIALLAGGVVVGSQWPWWVHLLGIQKELAGATLGLPLAVLAFLLARLVEKRHVRNVRVTRIDPSSDE
jgi:positive regulator of sigma E activity